MKVECSYVKLIDKKVYDLWSSLSSFLSNTYLLQIDVGQKVKWLISPIYSSLSILCDGFIGIWCLTKTNLVISTREHISEYKQNKDCLPLTGIETFSFGMEVKWPVSLILNHKAIACYQMIFRHLFYCKHVERLLCRLVVGLYNSNKIILRAYCNQPGTFPNS